MFFLTRKSSKRFHSACMCPVCRRKGHTVSQKYLAFELFQSSSKRTRQSFMSSVERDIANIHIQNLAREFHVLARRRPSKQGENQVMAFAFVGLLLLTSLIIPRKNVMLREPSAYKYPSTVKGSSSSLPVQTTLPQSNV